MSFLFPLVSSTPFNSHQPPLANPPPPLSNSPPKPWLHWSLKNKIQLWRKICFRHDKLSSKILEFLVSACKTRIQDFVSKVQWHSMIPHINVINILISPRIFLLLLIMMSWLCFYFFVLVLFPWLCFYSSKSLFDFMNFSQSIFLPLRDKI